MNLKKRLVLLLSDGKSQHGSIRGAGTNTVYWWFKKHIIGKYYAGTPDETLVQLVHRRWKNHRGRIIEEESSRGPGA
jgi:hypothetical protein